jgi:Ca2+-transporting ATPase
MESSAPGSAKARRGSFDGGGDTFDIPAKRAPIERLKKWRVSPSSSPSLSL